MEQPSQELFRQLAEFAPDALLWIDADGIIVFANVHAEVLFGYERGQLDGARVEQLIPKELRRTHVAHRSAYGQEPQLREMGHRNMPLFGLRRDGTRFRADIRLAPIKTARGHAIAAAVRDASETVELMSTLAAARRAAEAADEAKGRLLAAASHDLRQPLQTLRLLNSAMRRLTHDPSMQDVLAQEERALNTMSDLLHALLNIARLESGTLHAKLADVAVATVFDNLREQFAALAKCKQLELLVVDSGLYVHTDQVLMTEMLQNLLANALRYTDCGRITLSCTPGTARYALVEVADTGIGIPESEQGKIFEDFFQGAALDAEHRGGVGLGLGIVRRLSLLLNIPVHVSSSPGMGTRFTLEVPVAERLGSATPHRIGESACHKMLKILLIEDDRSMREALRTYLRLDGHEVSTAGSLTELAVVLEVMTEPPAILISDYRLGPTERGTEAIARIRRHFDNAIPAILLTGDTAMVSALRADELGLRLLNKPVDPQQLVATIDELLLAPGGSGPV